MLNKAEMSKFGIRLGEVCCPSPSPERAMSLNPRITHWQGRVVWLGGASTGIGRSHGPCPARRRRPRGRLGRARPNRWPALRRLTLAASPCRWTPQTPPPCAPRHAELLADDGRIDLAMYCAGHYHAMRATDFDLDDALRHQQINYVGALNMLDAVLPTLLRQAAAGTPAHLSLVASVAGYRGLPQCAGLRPHQGRAASTCPRCCTWICMPAAWACR
jgi:hypothetical protein